MSSDVSPSAAEKASLLHSLLEGLGSAVIAFSGGVDSTLLLKMGRLSGMRIKAVTAASETMPAYDLEYATAFAREISVDHLVIRTEELANDAFVSNTPERCYHCKEELFRKLSAIAAAEGFAFVLDGSNADDFKDYRPGRQAAAKYGVRSPLAECGLTKEEIREVSRDLGLSSWDRPSSPCLASRIPYGQRITAEGLTRTAKAEAFLRDLGIREVRVRSHNETARIEVQKPDMDMFLRPEVREKIVETLKSLGYAYVSLDLEGFRSGSLNRVLPGRK